MEFLQLDELQKQRNEAYYTEKGPGIYKDFKTFGSSRLISEANALEFYAFAKENEANLDNELNVYEFGVGNGKIAFYFLSKLKRIDPIFFKRVKYCLCDISKKMLENAEKINSFANVESICGDALQTKINDANYVRSNELYDDLPAKVFVIKERELFEVHYNEKLEKKYMKARNGKVMKFMINMPEGYEIPINELTIEHINKCIKNTKGYIDIFDYGFYDISEIKLYPKEMWNNIIVREFNEQVTVDVNFLHIAKNINASSEVQDQDAYLEKIYGQKFYASEKDQLYYSTRKKEDAEENYEYKHMRIACP
ncbi:MAG: SAM-dependent methyltransferase [Candidatus Micrarchaeota archaeon]